MSLLLDRNFIDGIREHFVAITVQFHELDNAGRPVGHDQFAVYSAFVIEIRGRWCLATAGHVISDAEKGVDALLNHPKILVRRIALADFFNSKAIIKKPTPFNYPDHQVIHIDNSGLDICIIPLDDFFRTSLAGNSISPLPCELWDINVPKCDEYALVGLPAEYHQRIDATEQRAAGISAQLVLVAVRPEPTSTPAPGCNIPRLVAELCDGGGLASVEGMSGGPIIGVAASGATGLRYTCIGVQSSWNKSTRKIYATPLGMVVRTIEIELDKATTAQAK